MLYIKMTENKKSKVNCPIHGQNVEGVTPHNKAVMCKKCLSGIINKLIKKIESILIKESTEASNEDTLDTVI